MRADWSSLPREARKLIEARTGTVVKIDPAPAGNHADIAAALTTNRGRVFVKAARKLGDKDGPEVRSLRWESAINPHVTEFAPRLLWQEEAGGWLMLGFEHVEGRHADYAPGSPDLEVLAKTLHALQSTPLPSVVKLCVESRWSSLADDVSLMAGDALLHTDVNPENLVITPGGRAYLVDWAFVSRGATWVELGLLIPWLLRAGHRPGDAAAWISQFPSWAEADPAAIDLFSRVFAERWRRRSERSTAPWAIELAALTQQWASYRLGADNSLPSN